MQANFTKCLIAIFAVGTLWLPVVSAAQETSRREFVREAKEQLAAFDARPDSRISRCRFEGVIVSPNLNVVRVPDTHSPLQLGDQILAVAGRRVSPPSVPRLSEILQGIGPSAQADVDVIRSGHQLTLTVQCEDSLARHTAFRATLQDAANGRFPSCIENFNRFAADFPITHQDYWLYFNCAFFAGQLKHPATYALAYYEYLKTGIEVTRWDTREFESMRALVVANRGFFADRGQLSLYDELQNQIRTVSNQAARVDGPAVRPESMEPAQSSGSAFFVSPDGLLITSAHVVRTAKQIRVTSSDGTVGEARIVAVSEATDLAVLQVQYKPLRYLSLAPPRSAAVGAKVFTYGFPVARLLGREPKFTDGTISSLSGLKDEQSFLQISVPVQPGNSGGPLVTDDGYVVGVIAAQAAIRPFVENTGSIPQNINWAVKSEYAALLVDLPPRQPPAKERDGAITLVRDAIGYVEVEHNR